MEQRLIKLEQDVAVISQTNINISRTLERLEGLQTDTKLMEERIAHMDKELIESFNRVNKRIDEETSFRNWFSRLLMGALIIGVIAATLHFGGTNGS